jgi:uroporphyrinogen decarboxylase
MKDTHFILLLCGDLEWPRFGATEEESWMNLVLYPQVCARIAELTGRRLIREVQLYARLGVDGIMPCGDLGSSTGLMASPRIYREMVYPWHKAVADEAHRLGLKVLKHCCGHIWPIIDEFASIYDAWEAIQATAGMDIRRLKERVGDRLTLWGGIWHEHIILGTPEDIREDARYAFTHAAPGGGYIMGSTHSLAVGARPENILEMKRCRDQWGIYPIDPRRFV